MTADLLVNKAEDAAAAVVDAGGEGGGEAGAVEAAEAGLEQRASRARRRWIDSWGARRLRRIRCTSMSVDQATPQRCAAKGGKSHRLLLLWPALRFRSQALSDHGLQTYKLSRCTPVPVPDVEEMPVSTVSLFLGRDD